MADAVPRVERLCRGMLIMAQQADTARAATAAKMLRETIRDLEVSGGEKPELLMLADAMREALRGVILLLKPLLATPDDVADEFLARTVDLCGAVGAFMQVSGPVLALAPVPAPPPPAAAQAPQIIIVDPSNVHDEEKPPAGLRNSSSVIEPSAMEAVIQSAHRSGGLAINIPPAYEYSSPSNSPRSASPRSASPIPSPRGQLTSSAPPASLTSSSANLNSSSSNVSAAANSVTSPRFFGGGSGITAGPGSPRPVPNDDSKKVSTNRLMSAVSKDSDHPLLALHALLMEHEGLDIVSLLAGSLSASGNEIDELATSLTLVFTHAQADLELLHFFISAERGSFAHITTTASEATLFRGADFASKLISAYGRNWAAPYLFSTLDPVFEEVTANKFDYEVDPNKLGFGVDIKKNQSRLSALCIRCVDDIIKSGKNFPIPIKALYFMAQAITVEKFPRMKYPILGGLFFLRLLCPSLLAPEVAGLRKVTDERARRALLLLGKFLQNMGNGVLFERKEAYMSFLNELLTAEKDRIHKFFDELVDLPQGEVEPMSSHLTDELALRALAAIRRTFIANMPKISENPPEAVKPALARLETILSMPFNDEAAFPPGLLQAQRELSARTLADEKEARAAEFEAEREARRCIRSMSNVGVVKQLQMNNLLPASGSVLRSSSPNVAAKPSAPSAATAVPVPTPAKPALPKSALLKPPGTEEAIKHGSRNAWVLVQFAKGKKWEHRLCALYEHLLCFYTGHKDPAPVYLVKLDKWAHIELPVGLSLDKPNCLAITGPSLNVMISFAAIQDTHAWRKAMENTQKEFLLKNK